MTRIALPTRWITRGIIILLGLALIYFVFMALARVGPPFDTTLAPAPTSDAEPPPQRTAPSADGRDPLSPDPDTKPGPAAKDFLHVLVESSAGLPIPGAQVVLTANAADGPRIEVLGVTDSQGLLRVPALAANDRYRNPARLLGEPARSIHAQVPGIRSDTKMLYSGQEATGPIVLTMRSGTWLEIDFPLLLARSTTRLAVRSDDSPNHYSAWFRVAPHRVDGDRAFQFVTMASPGANLEIAISDANNTPASSITTSIPNAPSDRTLIRLDYVAHVFLGRICQDPVMDRNESSFEAWGLTDEQDSLFATNGELNSDGTFLLVVAPHQLNRGMRSLVMSMIASPWGATIAVHALPQPGVTDLGEVTLEPLPDLARGLCVDDVGQPVIDASVAAYASDGPPGSRRLQVSLEGAGAFRVRGYLLGDRLMVGATAPKYIGSPPRDVVPGTVSLRIELRRAGSVIARLDRPLRLGLVAILAGEGSASAAHPADGMIDRAGASAWYWSSVPPDIYNLRISLPGTGVPLAEIPGVVVRPGQLTSGGRLDGIHVDIESCELLVEAEQRPIDVGRPSWGRGGYVFLKGDNGWHGFGFDPLGPVMVPLSRFARDALIVVPGYAPQVVMLHPGTVRVDLRPEQVLAISLGATSGARSIRLERPHGSPSDIGRCVVYEASKIVETWDGWPGLGRPWRVDGVLTFSVPSPGSYVVCIDAHGQTTRTKVAVPGGQLLTSVRVD